MVEPEKNSRVSLLNFSGLIKAPYFRISFNIALILEPSAFPFTLGMTTPMTFPISFAVEAAAVCTASPTIFLSSSSDSCSGR
jgi:hypothetical protein